MPNNVEPLFAMQDVESGIVYTFDVVKNFSKNDSSTITSYPTTEGTPKTDHIYGNPASYSVSIEVSSEVENDFWGSGLQRVKNCATTLLDLRNKAKQLVLSTPQGVYNNMFLSDIISTNDSSKAYNFVAELKFSEIFIASFEKITVDPIEIPEYGSTQQNGTQDGGTITQQWNDCWNELYGEGNEWIRWLNPIQWAGGAVTEVADVLKGLASWIGLV